MKRLTCKLLLIAAVLSASINAGAACDRQTIQGDFAASGSIGVWDGSDPDSIYEGYLAFRVTFDGRGGVTVRKGRIGALGQNRQVWGNGSYLVESDCTGVVRLNMSSPEGRRGRIRLDIIISGDASNPRITAFYSDPDEEAETGLLHMDKMEI